VTRDRREGEGHLLGLEFRAGCAPRPRRRSEKPMLRCS
jgi:hypothetical protein